jgi:hypothetical protein
LIGLRFHEVMKGRLAPQSTDPSGGHDYEGALAATLAARIDIQNLEQFVRGGLPHRARLSVELSIPILSDRPFVANDGKFELFQPGVLPPPEGVDGYLMVYEADVTNGDRLYEMKASKHLHPRRLWRVWRLWPETTTLFVTMRDITPKDDGDAPDRIVQIPVAQPLPAWLAAIQVDEPTANRDFHRPRFLAGIVHLRLGDFANQLLGTEAIGSPWFARLFHKVRFFAFFAGSIVRIYVFGKARGPL